MPRSPIDLLPEIVDLLYTARCSLEEAETTILILFEKLVVDYFSHFLVLVRIIVKDKPQIFGRLTETYGVHDLKSVDKLWEIVCEMVDRELQSEEWAGRDSAVEIIVAACSGNADIGYV